MKKHCKKVPGRKSPASRGKQVTRRDTAENGFRRAILIALQSAFGRRKKSLDTEKSVTRFIKRRVAAIKQRPRSVLKEFKSDVANIRIMLLEEKPVPRSLLGRILPRAFSKWPKVGQLLQYCRVGRALPKIPIKPSDLESQLARMQKPFDETIPHAVASILDDSIKWPKLESTEELPADLLSAASCIEMKRSEGGRTGLMRNSGLSLAGLSSADSGLIRADLYARNCIEVMLDETKFKVSSDCKPLAIAELGAKIRIVTKHNAALVAQSHRSRRTLWPLLLGKRNISVSESISDPELGTITFKDNRKAKEYRVFSADLSAATDYLGWPIIHYICDKVGIPYNHVCPTSIDGKEVKRGTAMGLPASWPVLSLAHYAICAAVDKDHNFRIKGDDLIALWDQWEIDHYYDLCSKVGFVPNKSKSALSSGRGIFCEVSYKREGNVLKRQPDYSIRSFVKNEPLSMEQWQMIVKYGICQKDLYNLSKDSHKSWFEMGQKAKINPYMPRKMGGLGMPPKDLEKQLSRRDAKVVNVVHNGLLPTLVEQKPTGSSSKIYMDFIKNNIHWTCNGGSHFKTHIFREYSGRFLFRSALVDAIRGETRAAKDRHRDVVRRAGDLLRRIRGQKSTFYPTTYGEAYSILDRLLVNAKSNVIGLGTTQWTVNGKRELSGWEFNDLLPVYDKKASLICRPGKHNNLTCKANYKRVLYDVQEDAKRSVQRKKSF